MARAYCVRVSKDRELIMWLQIKYFIKKHRERRMLKMIYRNRLDNKKESAKALMREKMLFDQIEQSRNERYQILAAVKKRYETIHGI